MNYISVEDYQSSIFSLNREKEDIEKYISLSIQDIEIITLNQLKYKFENLSDENKEIVKNVIVQHTDFIIENYDYLYSIVDSYKTLETQCEVGSQNCISINVIFILKKLYSLLTITGLINTKV